MSAKSKVRIYLTVHLTLITAAIAMVCSLFLIRTNLIRHEERILAAHQTANELRESSDDLTRMVRTYAVTGNPVYEKQYWAVLAIRNGKAPRPVKYQSVYWDLIGFDDTAAGPVSSPLALQKRMDSAGFTSGERAKLDSAQKNSDELVETERTAMLAMKDSIDSSITLRPIPGETNQQFAVRILYDSAYHAQKAKIMKPISDFITMNENRTLREIREDNRFLLHINLWLIGFVILSLVSFLNLLRLTRKEIAARTDSEEEARKSNAHLQTLINTLPDLVWLKDLNGVYLSCNERFEKFFGHPVNEIIGRSDYDFFPKELAEFFRENDRKAMELGHARVNEEEITFADDGHREYLETTKTPLRGADGEVIGVLGIGHNITERKEAERKIRLSEERLQIAARAASIGIWDWDVANNVLTWDDDMYRLYGIQRENFGGAYEAFTAALHPEDRERIDADVQAALRGEREYAPEFRIVWPDGTIRHIAAASQTFYDEQGNSVRMIGTNIDITERKQAEEMIRMSEQKFRNAFDYSAVGMALVSLDGHWLKTNRRLCEIVGYSESELQQMTFMEISLPEELEIDVPCRQQLIDGKIDSYQNEKRYIHKLGHTVWALLAVSLVRNENGDPVHIIAQIEDISERKKAEEELARFKYIADNAVYGQAIADMNGNFVYVNRFFAEIHGYSVEELLGKSITLFHSEDQLPMVEQQVQILMTEGQFEPVDIMHSHRDGTPFPMLMSGLLIRDSRGNPCYTASTAVDITELKRSTDELTRQRQIHIALLDNLSSGVFMIDAASGAPILANRRAKELLGYGILPDVTNENLAEVYHAHKAGSAEPYPVDEMPVVRGIHGESSRIDDMIVTRPDGTETWLEVFGTPVLNEKGDVWASIVSFQDITERKESEKERNALQLQLHQAQKMEAVGQLAGGVAHDYNNTLGVIMGAAEMILSGDQTRAEIEEYAQMIMKASKRSADLTRKLLLFSRKSVRENKVLDAAQVLADMTIIFRRTLNKNIALSFENHAHTTAVCGDESQLYNAFMNIGINGGHAMPDGGSLTITVENAELDEEYCERSPFEISAGTFVLITIRDTGTGISPENITRIFEPFFTTKELGKGSGLGLAAVYGTVQEHHGAITVYSEPGSGTVFHIYLPVHEDPAAVTDPAEADSAAEIASGSGTILLIDDEEHIRTTAAAMLKSMGYTVISADDGVDGVNTFSQISDQVDLIILDMIMPVMGGREAFPKLREIRADIPVVIASGFSKEEDLTELKKQGVSGFLNKPFRKAELAETAANAISGRSSAADLH